jgi:hypothetical protein
MIQHPTMTKREQALWETVSPAFAAIGMPDPAVDSADLWRCRFRLLLLEHLHKQGYSMNVLMTASLAVLANEVVRAVETERKRSMGDA